MRSAAGVLCSLCLSACGGRPPLAETPIVGGTADQRAAVEEELVAFETWAGEGRVRVSKIVFEDVTGQQATYQRSTARVQLDDAMSPRATRALLRHELCH